jgi:enhancing lycopene biosynthesis protein 2
MPKVAVILSGAGRMDGSEIHESTLALYFLARGGATYQCFAPNEPQLRVTNHITNQSMDETRNQMVEAARIARGEIKPLASARAADYDALVVPGGSGAGLNLGRGPGAGHPELKRLLNEAADLGKPIAAICIAPLLVARAIGNRRISLTVGNDPDTVAQIERAGARHVECTVDKCIVDEEHRIASTPAYMLGPGIADIGQGIEACIEALLELCAPRAGS